MDSQILQPHNSIELFVKSILVFEEKGSVKKTTLPFFADGLPGLIFHQTEGGLVVNPYQKEMPPLFLYGQTINPVEIVLSGAYQMIVFQLYPFVLKSLFHIDARALNEGCHNLEGMLHSVGLDLVTMPHRAGSISEKIATLTSFLRLLFQSKKGDLDLPIARAVKTIIEKNGQLSIGELYSDACMTERTFERRFLETVGVTAKQFSRMIQFQQSLEQLNGKEYTRLTDIVYSNGFADQSHFIKVFKAFTGKTPSAFRTQS